MGIPRSTYYYKPKGCKPSDADLADRIEEIALKYPSYGYRRITAELKRQRLQVNHKRVHRIMKEVNLLCRAKKSFKVTTNSAHSLKKYPNLIEDLVPYRPDQIWYADITYIRIATSFVYLAALIDGFSRKVVGYELGSALSADLTLSALLDAISKRDTRDLIHHSDQGIQYCSGDYTRVLEEHGILISMSGKANPYDNAKIESLFRTLKVEEVYMFEYETYRKQFKESHTLLRKSITRKDYILLWGIYPRKNLKILIIKERKISLIGWF